MRPKLRPFALAAFTIVCVLAAGTVAPFGSSQERDGFSRAASMPRAKPADRAGRDLAAATPESVGISSERLRRLDAAMKRLVDDKQVAGLVTLLERHGKVVALQRRRADWTRSKPDPVQKDSIFRIYSMTKPRHRRRDDDAVRGRQVAARRSGRRATFPSSRG